MIGILLCSVLFICGLICTFSSIPAAKKFLAKSFLDHHHQKNPSKPRDLISASEDHKHSSHTSSEKNDDLRSVFATFDKNKDGFITKQELRDSLGNIGISAGEKDVADMVEKVDSNGDGLIDFDEFCKLFESISSKGEISEPDGELKEAFDVFDGNRDGLITVEELGMVLSTLGFTEGNKLEDCKEMIRKVDVDGDGMVNFDEFKSMMRSGSMGKLTAVS